MGLIIGLIFLGVFAVTALLLTAIGRGLLSRPNRPSLHSTRPWPPKTQKHAYRY